MFDLILENDNGDQLTFGQGTPFTVTEIQGLNPPSATINTSQIAMVDGGKFNSSKLNMRTINIAFAIEYQPAANRIEIYKVLKSKQWVKMYYNGEYRQVFIEGYIQSIDISYFAMKQIVTCAILCPSPYFKEAQEIVDSLVNIVGMFHFPFASTAEPQLIMGNIFNELGMVIENGGDVDTGIIIVMYARSPISNPKVFNYITHDFIGVQYDMQTADQITIDTRKGEKSVTLLRGGVETNLFNYLMEGSTWLQLDASGSTFVHEVGTGDASSLNLTIKHYNLFEGV